MFGMKENEGSCSLLRFLLSILAIFVFFESWG